MYFNGLGAAPIRPTRFRIRIQRPKIRVVPAPTLQPPTRRRVQAPRLPVVAPPIRRTTALAPTGPAARRVPSAPFRPVATKPMILIQKPKPRPVVPSAPFRPLDRQEVRRAAVEAKRREEARRMEAAIVARAQRAERPASRDQMMAFRVPAAAPTVLTVPDRATGGVRQVPASERVQAVARREAGLLRAGPDLSPTAEALTAPTPQEAAAARVLGTGEPDATVTAQQEAGGGGARIKPVALLALAGLGLLLFMRR